MNISLSDILNREPLFNCGLKAAHRVGPLKGQERCQHPSKSMTPFNGRKLLGGYYYFPTNRGEEAAKRQGSRPVP